MTSTSNKVDVQNIYIFFGQVASNVGYLAINAGQMELLRAAHPNAKISVVFFGGNPKYIANAVASCGANLDNSFVFTPTLDKALAYLVNPKDFLIHTGAAAADLIVVASGEYYFSYKDNPNEEILFWRLLPIIAASENNQNVVMLPSTFGPIETEYTRRVVRSVLSITNAYTARESASKSFINELNDNQTAQVMLDPAFFLGRPVPKNLNYAVPSEHLAICMRSEITGMRVSKKQTAAQSAQNIEDQICYKFTIELCEQYLDAADSNTIVLYVQTIADEKLARAVVEKIVETNDEKRILIIKPNSAEDYLLYLSSAKMVIASRFHALILALVSGKPIFGIYFAAHGHKIPGLFELFEIESWCSELSAIAISDCVKVALKKVAEISYFPRDVYSKISDIKAKTEEWLSAVSSGGALHNSNAEAYELFVAAHAPRLIKEMRIVNHSLARSAVGVNAPGKKVVQQTPSTQVARFDKLQRENNAQKAQISSLQGEEKAIKSSTTFRFGQQVLRDARRPHHWPLLPLKLLRIYRQNKKRRVENKVVGLDDLMALLTIAHPETIETIDHRICYVLHNSLPYATGGYATRAHGLSKGFLAGGYEVFALTRPGFPLDTYDISAESVFDHEIDGVNYLTNSSTVRKGKSSFAYMHETISIYEAQFKEIRPSLVIAASFPLSALPAIIAAKRLGIPTIYELRGLEELTKLSKDPAYVETADFQLKVKVETATAQAADHIFTLTVAMQTELESRGVDKEKITILPNSCDIAAFSPREVDLALQKRYNIPSNIPVIGYIGSIVFYEGLEDLIDACGILKERGVEFRLLIVGSEHSSKSDKGPLKQTLENAARRKGFADWLIMPGRIPHEQVHAHYSLIDIAPFPRKSLPVCEVVSPMKPLEAMAMEKAVVVSSVKALTEIIEDGETGLVFEKGNVMSLVEKIEKLIKDQDLRQRLGKQARVFVATDRTWKVTASKGIEKIKALAKAPDTALSLPAWWGQIDADFAQKCSYMSIADWQLSDAAQALKDIYIHRFDEESVNRRIPLSNWKRADICWQKVPSDLSTIDVGSGLGEFVNLFAINNPETPIASVDTRDWDKYFDYTGRVERIYKNIFELGNDEVRDVVTCFEVIEHLPPSRVPEAVGILRKLARKKLFISVPFYEPLPLYKGHFTRFTKDNLLELMPDAKFTIFTKNTTNKNRVNAWILAQIDA